MPLPKISRYVKDGEVDPGVAAWAKISLGESAIVGKIVPTYHAELEAWFLASCGRGVFTVTKDPATGRYNGIDYVRNDQASIVDRGREDVYPQYRRVSNGRYATKNSNVAGVIAGDKTSNNFGSYGYWNSTYAEGLYKNLFKGHPRLQLIVEALMFYDPVGFFGEFLSSPKNQQNAYEHGIYIAEATASGVPLLGKKWIVAELVHRGETPAKALKVAEATYAAGSNYIAFKRYVERFYKIRDIMRQADPNISDAQVDAITNSPLTLDDVQAIADKIAPASSGITAGKLLTAAGAGTLAAFAFGGPIGIAVGAALLWLTSGSKPKS